MDGKSYVFHKNWGSEKDLIFHPISNDDFIQIKLIKDLG